MSGGIRFISAGAGSGKTYRLTQVLFEELQAGRVRPAGVLATTFTNRAATELRERVRSFLVEQGDYDGAVAIGAARIGTVNSVCGGLLQRFAFEAGLPTEQRVLDEARAGQLLRETIDTVIAGHSLTELLQVARRLSLDASPQDPLPPWQKALGSLVDQARANAIDADALRGAGGLNAANLLAHFPAPVKGDLDTRLGQAIAVALPEVSTALEQTRQKNVAEYLEQLRVAERSLHEGTLTWALWNKLTAAAPAKLRTVAEPIIEAAGLYTAHPRLRHDLTRYLELMYALAADSLDAYATAKRQIGALDFTDQERLLLDVLDDPFVASRRCFACRAELRRRRRQAQSAANPVGASQARCSSIGSRFRGARFDPLRREMFGLPNTRASCRPCPGCVNSSWRAAVAATMLGLVVNAAAKGAPIIPERRRSQRSRPAID